MNRIACRLAAICLGPALMVSQSAAHGGHAEAGGFAAGLLHPFLGLDHLLAALAVGAFAARRQDREALTIAAAFVVALGGGFALAGTALGVILLEPIVLASIFIIGAMAIAAKRLALFPMLGALAFFGAFHGYAHGVVGHDASGFLLGVMISTTALIIFSAYAIRLSLHRGLSRRS
ncbi:MAG: HupE/UreJ family protein [Pseudomonadota bacterium]